MTIIYMYANSTNGVFFSFLRANLQQLIKNKVRTQNMKACLSYLRAWYSYING